MAGPGNSGSRPVGDGAAHGDTAVDRGVAVERDVAVDRDATVADGATTERRFQSENATTARADSADGAPGTGHRAGEDRAREKFGGFNWGAAFFGWLVAIGIIGGALLLAVLMIAYYAGGYVAGRMSRFDGGRQGIGTWVIGLLVTIALAVAGAVLGSEYNLLAQVNLPSIPVGGSTLTTGGIIALAAIVLGTLLAAFLGGKAGTHYHRKVDAAGHA